MDRALQTHRRREGLAGGLRCWFAGAGPGGAGACGPSGIVPVGLRRWLGLRADEVIGGAGPTSWRVWQTPARWVSPAGADLGGGAAVVVPSPDVGVGDLWGWLCHLGPLCPASSAWDCSGLNIVFAPPQLRGVESVARGGRRPGP